MKPEEKYEHIFKCISEICFDYFLSTKTQELLKVNINNTGTVNISGTTNISSTIYKNPNSKYLPHVLAGTYNFDPTDFVDSEKFTITQSGENWIVAEKSQRR